MVTYRQILNENEPATYQVEGIVAVFRSARHGRLQFSLDLHTADEDREFLVNVVIPANRVWVAEEKKTIVGFIAFDADWINHLYIAPSFQGQGIGKQLLSIPKMTASGLRLWVFESNEPAIEFYQKQGFVIAERTDGSTNEAKKPDLLMKWNR